MIRPFLRALLEYLGILWGIVQFAAFVMVLGAIGWLQGWLRDERFRLEPRPAACYPALVRASAHRLCLRQVSGAPRRLFLWVGDVR